ncbi:MAG: RHS repeat-associated core domain-containing protein [Desulfuromonadales bacterium]|nr:RHS repeat-associated core domain-containing protein [Desulfuromonadales bacterium]
MNLKHCPVVSKKRLFGVEKPIGILPGQYYDAETGLNYNYFRDYNPAIGRYVEADPIGIKRGKNHLFLYGRNNTLRYTDFFGLDTFADLQKDADKAADALLKGPIVYCKCFFRWNRKRMECALEIDAEVDSEYRYYLCMWKALADLRGCAGVPQPRDDPFKPPPGWDKYPNPPGRGPKVEGGI